MKKLFVFILALISSGIIFAQQDPQFSHYMFSTLSYNPAVAGSSGNVNLGLVSRQQWVKFEGAPQTTLLSADLPVSIGTQDFGVGIFMLDDRYAFIRDFQMKLALSYKIELGAGRLDIGINSGLFSKEFNPEWKFPDQTEELFGKNNSMIFDMDFGLFYTYDNLYVGLSSTHILNPNFNIRSDNGQTFNLGLVRHFYLTSAYNISIPGSLFDITPSFLLKSDGNIFQFDFNLNLLYNKKFWSGVSYRNNESVILFVGTSYFNDIKIGFSYDVLINTINRVSNGTFEIYLGYNFSLIKMQKPQHYHNVKTL